MTDTTTRAPVSGWYADPSGRAPYRWWSGENWTTETLESLPSEAFVDCSEAALPTRRSLREARPVGGAPASGVTATSPTATPCPPASDRTQSTYVPVNPLAHENAHHGSASPATARWSTPAAWIANAPQQPDHAVYGTGVPFARQQRRVPLVRATNRPARNGFALGILSTLILIGVVGATVVTGRLYTVWSLWTVVGLICSIVGIVRANGWEARGLVPIGRARAVTGLVLCAVSLLGQTTETALAVAGSYGPVAVSPAGAAGSSAPGQAPVIGIPQPDGALVYSRAQAQSSIAAAYTSALKSEPARVACPTSEALAVSVSFSCRVVVAGGTATTAHVTIVDSAGHAEIQVS